MQNQSPKPYFNQITMIESQYESKRKNNSNPTASLLQTQTRSPLRERESTIFANVDTNSMNTPSRGNNGKSSLSPIRSRRNDSTMGSTRSTGISRRKNESNFCENHGNKSGKYLIEKDGECFYFCERCSIQLISNGFKLTKIETQHKNENSQRIKEINDFLNKLDNLNTNINKRNKTLHQIIQQAEKQLHGELQKVEQFYSQFYEIIDEHKKRVVGEIRAEYEKSAKSTKDSFQQIEKSISESNTIKEDILSSMNSVIIEVSEEDFRSVMTHYYTCFNDLNEVCTNKEDEPIQVRTLSFKNEENVCQAFVEGLVIEWDDEKVEGNEEEERERFEAPESDRLNPIECLETEERNKGRIKEIGGLFCSFDE